MKLVRLELRSNNGQTPQRQPEKTNRASAIRDAGSARSKERGSANAILAGKARNRDGSGKAPDVPNFTTEVWAVVLCKQVFITTGAKTYIDCRPRVRAIAGSGGQYRRIQGTEEMQRASNGVSIR